MLLPPELFMMSEDIRLHRKSVTVDCTENKMQALL